MRMRRRSEDEERLASASPERPPAQPEPAAEESEVLEVASAIGNRAFADLVGPSDARSVNGVPVGEGALVDGRGGTLQRQPAGGVLAPPALPATPPAVSATLARIRHTTTPAAMAVDRIPPRIDVPVAVTLSGWAIPMSAVQLAIENGGGTNGSCTIDGAATADLMGGGGTVKLRGVDQTGRGKGAPLRLVARFNGAVIARSNAFAVAAIPQNWTVSKLSELGGLARGLVVQDKWESDSGVVADLDATEISERVEETSSSGVLAGKPPSNSGYLAGDQFTTDTHGTPASFLTGPGSRVAAQTSMFKDHRTGVTDIPMTNSGYTLTRMVINLGPGSGWWLQTIKVGAATTAKGVSSAAGAGSAVALQAA